MSKPKLEANDMIFVNHVIDIQLMRKYLKFALEVDCQRFHLWNDPDKGIPEELSNRFAPYLLEKQRCEAVTLYGDDTDLIKTINCYRLNNDIVESLLAEFDQIVNNIESLAIYKKENPEWFLCMVFHEHMTLLRPKEEELIKFQKTEIPYSLEAPPNW